MQNHAYNIDKKNIDDPKEGRTIAIIPARGGSKSIPGKNTRPFNGQPLLYWTVLAAQSSKKIEKVFVATDDQQIGDTALSFNFDKVAIFERSQESATDSASSEAVLIEFCRQTCYESIVFMQVTNPFTTTQHLDAALTIYFSKQFDSILSVARQKRFFWGIDQKGAFPLNYEYNNRPLRQKFKGVFMENGAFYINSRENILKYRNRICGRIGVFEMPPYSFIEIDEIEDWIIAEALFRELSKRQTDNQPC